jgi:hypothetical protein
LQLGKNGSELVLRGRRLRPLDDEALLVRGRRLRDNVEVDVVHNLSRAQSNPRNIIITIGDVSWGLLSFYQSFYIRT